MWQYLSVRIQPTLQLEQTQCPLLSRRQWEWTKPVAWGSTHQGICPARPVGCVLIIHMPYISLFVSEDSFTMTPIPGLKPSSCLSFSITWDCRYSWLSPMSWTPLILSMKTDFFFFWHVYVCVVCVHMCMGVQVHRVQMHGWIHMHVEARGLLEKIFLNHAGFLDDSRFCQVNSEH